MRVPIAGCIGYEPLGAEERLNLAAVIESGHLTAGKWTRRFEDELASYYGVKHAITVNSGSSANLLAVAALGLRPGDEVITNAVGFPTTVAPIVQHGGIPVFVDPALPNCNPTVEGIERALSRRTRAVILAHTLGFPFDPAIIALCRGRGVALIEDNCDAAGAMINLQRTGSFGDLATLSFYPAHHMTTGEGGAVLTSDDGLATIVRSLRDWGRDCICPPACDNTCGKRFAQKHGDLPFGYDHKYVYSRLGYNLKMTDMQAAIGVAQVRGLPITVAKRQDNWHILASAVGFGIESDRIQSTYQNTHPSPFGFLVIAQDECHEKVAKLEAAGVQTRPLFAGNMVRHPAMARVPKRVIGLLPNADIVTHCAFWVGVHPKLTPDMLDHLIVSLRGVLR